MSYKPGDPYVKEFTTSNPTTGAAVNADSLPVATANRNGVDDAAFVLTVANLDTGRYKITGTIPSGYVAGDVLNVSVAATVVTIAGKAVVDTQVLDARRLADTVVRSGTAQAGTAASLRLDAGASAVNDFYKGLLLAILAGAGAGQTRVVRSYNGTSKQALVDWNWLVAPDNTSVYALTSADSPVLNAALAVAAAPATVVIRSSTVPLGGQPATTIKLDVGASATSKIYNGDLITLTGGTGLGQTRVIMAYDGPNKIATVDKAWNTPPDPTSTFSIYANITPTLFSAPGVAVAATPSTLTLDTAAAAATGIYVGSLVTILAGTGSGQTAEITAYNGATKVATIVGTWAVTPDTTSVYAVIPTANSAGVNPVAVNFPANISALAVSTAGGVTLADGVAHGGPPGFSSTATLSLQKLNIYHPTDAAVSVWSSGGAGAMVIQHDGGSPPVKIYASSMDSAVNITNDSGSGVVVNSYGGIHAVAVDLAGIEADLRMSGNVGGITGNLTGRILGATSTPFAGVGAQVALSQAFPANFAVLAIDTNGRVQVKSGITRSQALPAFEVYMTDARGNALVGLTVTATVSRDGAAPVPCANPVAEVGGGLYKIDLTTTDTNAGVFTLTFTAPGAAPRFVTFVTTS